MKYDSFGALIFTGGANQETHHVIKTLSAKVANKRNLEYSIITNCFRSKIYFGPRVYPKGSLVIALVRPSVVRWSVRL